MPELLNIILRTLGLFVLVLFAVRLMGPRQTAQMTFFDMTSVIIIGFIAGAMVTNLIGIVPGLIALGVWSILFIGIYLLALKYKVVRDIVQGKEKILINHGKVLEDKLLEARYTPEDLLGQLRRKNVFQVSDVEFAILEPNGELSIMLKKDKQPLSAKIMGLKVANESVPQTVMLDGEIMDEALTAVGLNRKWLYTELEKAGVALENVFIAQVDSSGQLYLDLFNDGLILPQPSTKELAFATLKKCQADCELYALATKDQKAKKMYGLMAGDLQEIIQDTEPLLNR